MGYLQVIAISTAWPKWPVAASSNAATCLKICKVTPRARTSTTDANNVAPAIKQLILAPGQIGPSAK